MRWRSLSRRIEALRDGGLSPRAERRLRRRLDSDPDAAELLRRTESLGRAILEAWNDGPPGPDAEDLLVRLRPALQRTDRELEGASLGARLRSRARRWLSPARPAVVTAAFAAAVVVGMLILPPLSQSPTLSGVARAQAATEVRSLRSPESVTVFLLEGGEGCAIIWVVEEGEDPDLSGGYRGRWS